jgi:hypothetical protein
MPKRLSARSGSRNKKACNVGIGECDEIGCDGHDELTIGDFELRSSSVRSESSS